MMDCGAPVERVAYPCVLLDDDDWLITCADGDEVRDASEPDFLSDIREAFDAGGRPLRLFVVGRKGNDVDFELTGPPEPERLRRCVESFFHHWTDSEPPAYATDTPGYVAAVVRAAESVPIRRRKRRETKG